jgi:hypothetical protein
MIGFVSFYFYQRGKKIVFSLGYFFQLPILIASVTTISIFANYNEIISSTPLMYYNFFQDFYWFTAMTSSIKDLDFTNSNFEQGTGVYHHILGIFPAAFISSLTKLSSHTSLWSITMPIAIFSSFSSLIVIIEVLLGKIKMWILIFALIVFVFHFPINPKCFFNGNLSEAIWYGSAHTLPVLPTWAAVYCISVPLIIVLFKSKEINFLNVFIVSSLTFMLAWAKITSIFVFYPLVLFFLAVTEKKIMSPRQLILIISSVPVILLITLYYSHSSAKFIFEPGQIIIDNLGKNSVSFHNFILAITISLLTLVIWIGAKWMLFLRTESFNNQAALSFLIVLLICLSIQVFLKIKSFDYYGRVLDDSSYDLQQFMRSTFIYLDIFALVLFVKLLKSLSKNKVDFRSILIILCPATLMSFSIILMVINPFFYFPNYQTSNKFWDKQVVLELHKFKNTKKAMVSNYQYSGQFIAAHDINNFYLSVENRNGGYTYNYENRERYNRLKSLINEGNPRTYLTELKKNKVKILIATPITIEKFRKLVKKGWLKEVPNTDWLFSL